MMAQVMRWNDDDAINRVGNPSITQYDVEIMPLDSKCTS
jgi:hypothetical protein